jgi:hypothetical protein
MEVVRPSETLVSAYKLARRYNHKTNTDIFIAVRTSNLVELRQMYTHLLLRTQKTDHLRYKTG